MAVLLLEWLVAHNCWNNVLTRRVEVTSHTESPTRCYSIKNKGVKTNKWKSYVGAAIRNLV